MGGPNHFRQGEHICLIYYTAEEQRAVAVEYVADGLRAGERVYFVADTREALDRFNAALAAAGVDVDEALRTTALVEATHREAHLVDGSFDGERMLRLLNDGIEEALNAGFAGLRTCGDMSWLLGEPPGAEQVVEYEALVTELFRGTRACGMCLYDAARLPSALVEHGLATHPTVVVDQDHTANMFYRPSLSAGQVAQRDDLGWKLQQLRNRTR